MFRSHHRELRDERILGYSFAEQVGQSVCMGMSIQSKLSFKKLNSPRLPLIAGGSRSS